MYFYKVETEPVQLSFYKFHGTGNDFIVVDNRDSSFAPADERRKEVIARLCARHFGIGADGMILLERDTETAFRMLYFNADGGEGSFCGNGSRCVAAFARHMGIVAGSQVIFRAMDGVHKAEIHHSGGTRYMVSVSLQPVAIPRKIDRNTYSVNTGSPHLVVFSDAVRDRDVAVEGRKLRYAQAYAPEGINVNFVEPLEGGTLLVRTYERGVERETLSCGSGVTASAIAAHVHSGYPQADNLFRVETPGGSLSVDFTAPKNGNRMFTDVVLTGEVECVYKGDTMCQIV